MTDRMIFGMRVLNIAQAGTKLTGKPSLSHVSYELDLAGSDSGIDYWYCSCSFDHNNALGNGTPKGNDNDS